MMLASNTLITELLAKLRPHIACLYALSETVGLTDMLVSIATVCADANTGKTHPRFKISIQFQFVPNSHRR